MKNARSTKNKVIVNGQIAENVIIRMFVMNGVIKMGMSIDEAIKILHGRDKCMEYVTDNDSEAFDIAIDTMRKYQQLQADYETRLKSDVVPTPNAIPIPEGATNGDMIKALWNLSDNDIDIGFSTVYVYTNIRVFNGQDRERLFFNKDWWNAPYKEQNE